MTVEVVAGMVCSSLLAGLVLVLSHLKAMRATSGEVAAFSGRIDLLAEHLKQTNEKVTLLNNRTQK